MSPCDHPRTSVVIPARNVGKTLANTLDSLLAQSDPDWEALIIDDGSSDETADLIKRYTQREGRFVSLAGAGVGVSAARNVGLSRASGRRVLFLDSDDWIEDRFLELMNGTLDLAPDAVAAYCGYCRVMPDGLQTPPRSDPRIAEAPFRAFARSCALAIHAVLIERAIVSAIGGFDTSLRTCEDWDLWQRATRMGGRWVHVDAPLSYYRVSEHSLTRDTRQMLSDAAIVIGRAFSADERLFEADVAHPGDACTADGEAAGLAFACFALWCGAFDCGRGGTGAGAVAKLGGLPSPLESVRSIADTLVDGLMVGLRAVPAQLAARWPDYGSRMTALITEIGRAWNGSGATRRLQYAMERLILDCDDLGGPRHLSLTLGLRVDLRSPKPVTPPPGVDRLYVYLCDGCDVRALADLGALGTITTRHWLELAVSRLGFAEVMAIAHESPGWSLAWHTLAHALGEVRRAPRTALRRRGWRHIRAAAAQKALFGTAGPRRPAGSHREQLDRLQKEADHPATRPLPDLNQPLTTVPRDTHKGNFRDHRAYWEGLFQEPDPWNYGSRYEQEKYARQLMLLPDRPIGRAVELACAEGRFTEKIAPLVEQLIAADISATALERARVRCRSQKNIEFRCLDLAVDALPEGVDLIVCSEVLYYLDDEAELERVAQRLAAALRPGGHILTAHAFVLKDDLSRTGFDWESPWGAATINRVFTAVRGLSLERSLCTELYRIDRYVRLEEIDQGVRPMIENLPITGAVEPEVARHVVWGGAAARRAELAATERHERAPVLLYHRIADDGPKALARYRVSRENFQAQMAWLRRNGYHSLLSEELAWFLDRGHPFVGRPVMITFDDGFRDFAELAWTILRLHDFRPEVFVATDLVGGVAEWDRHLGEPAPLMDAPTIGRLASEGVSFGSHLASHRSADGLSTRELADELTRSRADLGQWMDRPADSFAAPFGRTDERLRLLTAECGFRTGFNTEPGVAHLKDDPFNLPRLEIRGDLTLEEFIYLMRANR